MATAAKKYTYKKKTIIDPNKPLRYALYVRKSSEGEDAQAKSLPDQIKACMDWARQEGLIIVGKPIREAASAKAAYNRPKFTQLLKDVENGKYDGIIAWHPDRLARNALEAGMVIDMIDNSTIKDLRFPTFHFTNDANGKTMLGILFVMSKQYSEHLSETVQRGVDSNLEQGKSAGVHKWGFVRDDVTGYYEPDLKHFGIIKRGWEMRAEGRTIESILEYWKSHDVHRYTKITRKNKKRRKITLDSKQTASKLFHDPFYYGILIQAEQEVDLRLVSNFTPMITQELYEEVQTASQERARIIPSFGGKKRATFYPLRAMVLCDVCGSNRPMVVGKNKSSTGKYYLTYRCDNKDCKRNTKSVRAKYIFDNLYKILGKLKFTEKEYARYSKHIDQYTDEKIIELRQQKRSLNGKLSHQEKAVAEKSRQWVGLPANTPQSIKNTIIRDLESLENDVIDTKEQLDSIDKKLVDPGKVRMAKEEFLNLTNSLADKMMAGSSVEKDILCRALFLNVHLNNENDPSFIWKEPFATLLQSKKINSGAAEVTKLELLLNNISQWLFENQNYTIFRLPKVSVTERSQQIAEANYAF